MEDSLSISEENSLKARRILISEGEFIQSKENTHFRGRTHSKLGRIQPRKGFNSKRGEYSFQREDSFKARKDSTAERTPSGIKQHIVR